MVLVVRTAQMAAMAASLPRMVLPCDIWVRVAVRDYFHRPFAARPFEMVASGQVLNGTTTPEGVMAVRLPRDVQVGTLKVWMEGKNNEPETWDLEIGEMEPASSKEGAVARLQSLEFLQPGQDMGAPLAFEEAVANFQAWAGLPVTGDLDTGTAGALDLACRPPLSSNPAQSSLPPNPEAASMWAEWEAMLAIDAAPLPEDDD